MIMDRQTMLSVAQAITTGTAVSTNSYDLGVPRDLGAADVELACEIVQAFAGGTSLQVNLITSANADLSSPVIVLSSPVYLTANLTLGKEIFRVELPALTLDTELLRYIGTQYVAAGTFTTGAVTTGLVLDRYANRAYASGLNVGGF